jgi:hypothetical protein
LRENARQINAAMIEARADYDEGMRRAASFYAQVLRGRATGDDL